MKRSELIVGDLYCYGEGTEVRLLNMTGQHTTWSGWSTTKHNNGLTLQRTKPTGNASRDEPFVAHNASKLEPHSQVEYYRRVAEARTLRRNNNERYDSELRDVVTALTGATSHAGLNQYGSVSLSTEELAAILKRAGVTFVTKPSDYNVETES